MKIVHYIYVYYVISLLLLSIDEREKQRVLQIHSEWN